MSGLSMQQAGPQGVNFNCVLSPMAFQHSLIPLAEGFPSEHTLAILERLDIVIRKGAELGLNSAECRDSKLHLVREW